MAIKGKGRTRSRRVIAAPPRPQLMIRKKPFVLRRSTWIGAGAVLLAGIGLLVFLALRSNRAEAREDRERTAVRVFANLIQANIPPGATSLGPSSNLVFPTVLQDLASLGAGDLKAPAATRKANELTRAAREGADGMEEIIVRRTIPDEFPQTRLELLDAQFMMAQGLRTYERVGGLMKAAIAETGAQRTAITEEAAELATQAGTLFDRGWTKLNNIRDRLGIAPPFNPNPIPQPSVPVPTLPPSPAPSAASATPSPSPEPSPSASPTG